MLPDTVAITMKRNAFGTENTGDCRPCKSYRNKQGKFPTVPGVNKFIRKYYNKNSRNNIIKLILLKL